MKKFKYIAENAKETRTEGVKKAENEEDVVEWIYDSGLKPVAITEILPEKKQTSREQVGRMPGVPLEREKMIQPTRQVMAEIFQYYAEKVKSILSAYEDEPDDPRLCRLYKTYRQVVRTWTILHKGVKNCPDPDNIPATLRDGNDNAYLCMQRLLKYCKNVKTIRRYHWSQDLLPPAEKIVNEGRFESIDQFAGELGCSINTVKQIAKMSDTVAQAIKANKTHPKTHKVVSLTDETLKITEKPDETPELVSSEDADIIFKKLLEGLLENDPSNYDQAKEAIAKMDTEAKRRFATDLPDDYLERPEQLRKDAYKTQKQIQHKQL